MKNPKCTCCEIETAVWECADCDPEEKFSCEDCHEDIHDGSNHKFWKIGSKPAPKPTPEAKAVPTAKSVKCAVCEMEDAVYECNTCPAEESYLCDECNDDVHGASSKHKVFKIGSKPQPSPSPKETKKVETPSAPALEKTEPKPQQEEKHVEPTAAPAEPSVLPARQPALEAPVDSKGYAPRPEISMNAVATPFAIPSPTRPPLSINLAAVTNPGGHGGEWNGVRSPIVSTKDVSDVPLPKQYCDNCEGEAPIVWCLECCEQFCTECDVAVHVASTTKFSTHHRKKLVAHPNQHIREALNKAIHSDSAQAIRQILSSPAGQALPYSDVVRQADARAMEIERQEVKFKSALKSRDPSLIHEAMDEFREVCGDNTGEWITAAVTLLRHIEEEDTIISSLRHAANSTRIQAVEASLKRARVFRPLRMTDNGMVDDEKSNRLLQQHITAAEERLGELREKGRMLSLLRRAMTSRSLVEIRRTLRMASRVGLEDDPLFVSLTERFIKVEADSMAKPRHSRTRSAAASYSRVPWKSHQKSFSYEDGVSNSDEELNTKKRQDVIRKVSARKTRSTSSGALYNSKPAWNNSKKLNSTFTSRKKSSRRAKSVKSGSRDLLDSDTLTEVLGGVERRLKKAQKAQFDCLANKIHNMAVTPPPSMQMWRAGRTPLLSPARPSSSGITHESVLTLRLGLSGLDTKGETWGGVGGGVVETWVEIWQQNIRIASTKSGRGEARVAWKAIKVSMSLLSSAHPIQFRIYLDPFPSVVSPASRRRLSTDTDAPPILGDVVLPWSEIRRARTLLKTRAVALYRLSGDIAGIPGKSPRLCFYKIAITRNARVSSGTSAGHISPSHLGNSARGGREVKRLKRELERMENKLARESESNRDLQATINRLQRKVTPPRPMLAWGSSNSPKSRSEALRELRALKARKKVLVRVLGDDAPSDTPRQFRPAKVPPLKIPRSARTLSDSGSGLHSDIDISDSS